jgi:hypothetical protein
MAQPTMMEEISEGHCQSHKEEINGLLQRMSIGQRMQNEGHHNLQHNMLSMILQID